MQRKFLFFIISIFSTAAFGACPTGYITINRPNVIVTTETACPTGYVSAGSVSSCANSSSGVCFDICPTLPANAYWVNANTCTWACNDGYGVTSLNTCAQMCTAGVRNLRTSTGVSVPLYATPQTTPSINVSVGGTTCYGNLATGNADGAINVQYNGATYHTTN